MNISFYNSKYNDEFNEELDKQWNYILNTDSQHVMRHVVEYNQK